MISENTATDILSRTASAKASGKSVDHEIVRRPGKVFRNRLYRVYLPANYDELREYPLVVVLHGCQQNHHSIQAICGFDAIADREGFIVVYPFVTSYSGMRNRNCWGWWLPRERQRGRGEVSDLHQIAEQVMHDYPIDKQRVHICGLSSGAGMSVAALVGYNKLWRSGASVAGVPFGESSRSVRISRLLLVRRKSVKTLVRILKRTLKGKPPPLLIVQSRADKIVGPALGANLRDSWLKVSGDWQQPDSLAEGDVHSVHWELTQYLDDTNRSHVTCLFMDKGSHGWPGGVPGKFSVPEAPNVSELIWTFFNSQ